MSRSKGRLFVISGPSGTGKGTICKELLKDSGNDFSVSLTTRQPRPGETDGKDYCFVTREQFLDNVRKGNFLEYADVFGNLYGTPRDRAMKSIDRGRNMILDIDVQGGLQVKESMPEAILIFILPPDMAELRRRLEGRGTEDQETIEKRLSKAHSEISLIGEYDYYLVNDDLDIAVDKVRSIMRSESMRVPDMVMPIIRKYE